MFSFTNYLFCHCDCFLLVAKPLKGFQIFYPYRSFLKDSSRTVPSCVLTTTHQDAPVTSPSLAWLFCSLSRQANSLPYSCGFVADMCDSWQMQSICWSVHDLFFPPLLNSACLCVYPLCSWFVVPCGDRTVAPPSTTSTPHWWFITREVSYM